MDFAIVLEQVNVKQYMKTTGELFIKKVHLFVKQYAFYNLDFS